MREQQPTGLYEVKLSIEDVRMIHTAIQKHLQTWAGGDPIEQEHLWVLRDGFFSIILEDTFHSK